MPKTLLKSYLKIYFTQMNSAEDSRQIAELFKCQSFLNQDYDFSVMNSTKIMVNFRAH